MYVCVYENYLSKLELYHFPDKNITPRFYEYSELDNIITVLLALIIVL